jgi:hypothetical protein
VGSGVAVKHSPEEVHEIAAAVYRRALSESAGGLDAKWRDGEADRMIAKDGDGGVKLGARARAYERIVRLVLEVLDDRAAG